MKKPNSFIVGAPKCGTTALSEYLRLHPNVFMCPEKEPHYFSTDFPKYRVVNTEAEYLALFEKATSIHLSVIEASVFYLYSKIAIQNIKIFNSNAKIIVMFRNPVELVYSMHSQLLYSKDEDEEDFIKAWGLIEQRKKGLKIPKKCRDRKLLYYDEIAKFGKQYENLISIFPKEQIKIIFFEQFSRDTHFIYKEILKFLDLPDDCRNNFPKINQNKRHRISLLGSFTQHPPKNLLKLILNIKKVMGIERLRIIETLREFNTKNYKRPPLPNEFKKIIIKTYYSDIVKLSRLTDQNLNHWLEQ